MSNVLNQNDWFCSGRRFTWECCVFQLRDRSKIKLKFFFLRYNSGHVSSIYLSTQIIASKTKTMVCVTLSRVNLCNNFEEEDCDNQYKRVFPCEREPEIFAIGAIVSKVEPE